MNPGFLLADDAGALSLPDAASDSLANAAAAAAAAAPSTDGDWFGSYVNLIEAAIKLGDGALVSMTGEQSIGLSIVLFTVFVKIITYPLTYAQLSSTSKMQALQPRVKAIQSKFQSNPELLQRELGALYTDNGVNPLAGCLPSIVQIPIFIGLYRALLKLGTDKLLNEPFLWFPNLEGPVYGSTTSDWLFKGWVDGVPSLGWHDTLAFLTMPAILVAVQTISQKALQPPVDPNQSEQQAATQATLQFLPLLFAFFALNVPCGLGVYWITNSVVSTATMIFVKSRVNAEMAASGMASTIPFTAPPSAASFAPMRDAPSSSTAFESRISPVDAEVVDPALRPAEGFSDAGFSPDSATKKKKKKGARK